MQDNLRRQRLFFFGCLHLPLHLDLEVSQLKEGLAQKGHPAVEAKFEVVDC